MTNPVRIELPCNGDAGTIKIRRHPDEIIFATQGACKFTSFKFEPVDPPPGFSKGTWSSDGKTIKFDYDGKQMPPGGYKFDYDTAPDEGNGTGVIKN